VTREKGEMKKDFWVPANNIQGFRIFIEKKENWGYFGGSNRDFILTIYYLRLAIGCLWRFFINILVAGNGIKV